MEPENRPYVAPDTKPGDPGTEDWADTLPDADGAAARGRPAASQETVDEDGIVDGSPADEFVNDPNVIRARKDEGKPA